MMKKILSLTISLSLIWANTLSYAQDCLDPKDMVQASTKDNQAQWNNSWKDINCVENLAGNWPKNNDETTKLVKSGFQYLNPCVETECLGHYSVGYDSKCCRLIRARKSILVNANLDVESIIVFENGVKKEYKRGTDKFIEAQQNLSKSPCEEYAAPNENRESASEVLVPNTSTSGSGGSEIGKKVPTGSTSPAVNATSTQNGHTREGIGEAEVDGVEEYGLPSGNSSPSANAIYEKVADDDLVAQIITGNSQTKDEDRILIAMSRLHDAVRDGISLDRFINKLIANMESGALEVSLPLLEVSFLYYVESLNKNEVYNKIAPYLEKIYKKKNLTLAVHIATAFSLSLATHKYGNDIYNPKQRKEITNVLVQIYNNPQIDVKLQDLCVRYLRLLYPNEDISRFIADAGKYSEGATLNDVYVQRALGLLANKKATIQVGVGNTLLILTMRGEILAKLSPQLIGSLVTTSGETVTFGTFSKVVSGVANVFRGFEFSAQAVEAQVISNAVNAARTGIGAIASSGALTVASYVGLAVCVGYCFVRAMGDATDAIGEIYKARTWEELNALLSGSSVSLSSSASATTAISKAEKVAFTKEMTDEYQCKQNTGNNCKNPVGAIGAKNALSRFRQIKIDPVTNKKQIYQGKNTDIGACFSTVRDKIKSAREALAAATGESVDFKNNPITVRDVVNKCLNERRCPEYSEPLENLRDSCGDDKDDGKLFIYLLKDVMGNVTTVAERTIPTGSVPNEIKNVVCKTYCLLSHDSNGGLSQNFKLFDGWELRYGDHEVGTPGRNNQHFHIENDSCSNSFQLNGKTLFEFCKGFGNCN